MNISKYILVVGALTLLPSLARADRDDYYGRRDYSRPDWAANNWQRPESNYRYNYNYGQERYRGDPVIQQGIASGRLSQAEVRDLREKKRDLEEERREFLADGYLSKNERKDLEKDYRKYNKDVNHELNDGERASPRGFFHWW